MKTPPPRPRASVAELEALRPAMVRIAERIVGPGDAEDVVQTAVIKAAAAIPELREAPSLRGWLAAITARSALDLLRTRREALLPLAPEAGDEAVLERGAEAALDLGQERDYLRREMSACVQEHLQRLPERHRLVLVLSEVQELGNSEIAELLGVSLGAAKIRLHRARAALRETLGRCCSFYRDERNVLCCDPKGRSSPAPSPR